MRKPSLNLTRFMYGGSETRRYIRPTDGMPARSEERQPESGKITAFETRYEVSTQVDSSALAERFPAMCGRATFAMEVSRTSMNVASVTVTAITQGLIEPSGVRSLEMNLSITFAQENRPTS